MLWTLFSSALATVRVSIDKILQKELFDNVFGFNKISFTINIKQVPFARFAEFWKKYLKKMRLCWVAFLSMVYKKFKAKFYQLWRCIEQTKNKKISIRKTGVHPSFLKSVVDTISHWWEMPKKNSNKIVKTNKIVNKSKKALTTTKENVKKKLKIIE